MLLQWFPKAGVICCNRDNLRKLLGALGKHYCIYSHIISIWGMCILLLWRLILNTSMHSFSSPKSCAWANTFWARNLVQRAHRHCTSWCLLPAVQNQYKRRCDWSALCLLGHKNLQFRIRSCMKILNEISFKPWGWHLDEEKICSEENVMWKGSLPFHKKKKNRKPRLMTKFIIYMF